MYVISYSLWGNIPLYCKGAIITSIKAKEMYPSWEMRVYINDTVPINVVHELESNGVNCINVGGQNMNCWNSLWRFYPSFDSDVDVFISRDVDSQILYREVDCVRNWMNSDKQFHIMRDHPQHGLYIAAGMFGLKKGALMTLFAEKLRWFLDSDSIRSTSRYKQLLDNFNLKGIDQDFLNDYIYPHTKSIRMTHVGDGLFTDGDIRIPKSDGNYIAILHDRSDINLSYDELTQMKGHIHV